MYTNCLASTLVSPTPASRSKYMRKPHRRNPDANPIPIGLAIKEAHKSPMQIRVGAVLFKGRTILGTGYSHHTTLHDPNKRISIHAEQATLVGLRHDIIAGSNIVIVRIGKRGDLLAVHPCPRCIPLLTRKGVHKVYCWSKEVDLMSIIL
jgi:deoxycytidylate deaminase